MTYIPVAQRQTSVPTSTPGYVPVAERKAVEEGEMPSFSAFTEGVFSGGSGNTTKQYLTPEEARSVGLTPLFDVSKAVVQGALRSFAAGGAAIAGLPKQIINTVTGKGDTSIGSLALPNDGSFYNSFLRSFYGVPEEENHISLETTGKEIQSLPFMPQGSESSLFFGALGSILDLTGAGGLKGLKGLTGALKTTEDVEEASKLLRGAGFDVDIANNSAPLFAKMTNAKQIEEGLLKLETFQNTTKKASQPVVKTYTGTAPETAIDAAARYWDDVLKPSFDGGNPIIIGADDLKDYFGRDYDISRHPIYSQGANELLKRAAKENPDPNVIFMAGGPGSGKSEVIRNSIAPGFKGVIYDSNLSNLEGALRQIETMEKMGKKVDIVGVLRDPESAYAFTKAREAAGGHPVSDKAFIRNHSGVPQVLLKLQEAGKNVQVVDVRGMNTVDDLKYAEVTGDSRQLLTSTLRSEDDILKVTQNYVKSKINISTDARSKDSSLLGRSEEGGHQGRKDIESGGGTRLLQRGNGDVPTYAQLDELGRRASKGDKPEDLEELITEMGFYSDAIETMPGKQLSKYVSRSTGQLPEITGKSTMRAMSGSGKTVATSEFGRKGDQIIQEIFGSERNADWALAQKAVDDYKDLRARVDKLQETITDKRKNISAERKLERVSSLAAQERRSRIRALKERYDLTDSELASIRGRRDFSTMSKEEFAAFMVRAEELAEELATKTEARIQLEATIHQKELQKWENVRDLLKLPKNISQMSTEQMNKLNEVLSQYKTGDEFLPTRMMETLPNSRLAEVKTVREVLEVLAKDKDLTVADVMMIKPTEYHRMMDDNRLARQNPFYSRMVFMKNKSFLEANARILELSDKADVLIKAARASRTQGIGDRLIPTDKSIVKWLEANHADRMQAAKEMTVEELKAAQFMDDAFKQYYEYLVAKKAGQKFSRFEDKYFPHIRRSFLEAWKEDGLFHAFKELRVKYSQDQKYLDILNERTGEILPYEKWIGFTQFRTNELIPTSNAHRAFEGYITALEKGRSLDAMIPEMMAYVHSLSPRRLSERGIELDTSLKRFVKEWVNAQKGRTPKGFFEPGGKTDWVLRSSTSFTRMIDLGFNFTTQFAAPIGENIMTLTMLKSKAYATAWARKSTKQGGEILKKYQNFTGRSVFAEASKASATIGDQFMAGMFALYGIAAKNGNELFLLGKMTDEEFKSGVISTDRLAKLQVEMGKYRAVKGAESVLGRTSEAEAVKQYKSWAIPIVRATVSNSLDLAKIIRTKGVGAALASDEGKELFYSVGIGAALGASFWSQYESLADKKDRTFLEDAAYKAMRDSLSILGALDPTLWSTIRVADFYEDLAQALKDLVTLDTYKTSGELKGPAELMRVITPAPIRQIGRSLEQEDDSTPTPKKFKTPPGLPALPEMGSSLPPLPKLPSL